MAGPEDVSVGPADSQAPTSTGIVRRAASASFAGSVIGGQGTAQEFKRTGSIEAADKAVVRVRRA